MMKRSRFTQEQIIGVLKEHQAGASAADLCRKHGISDSHIARLASLGAGPWSTPCWSEHRDVAAAKAFFRSATATIGFQPDRVTRDGHGFYPRAIRIMPGEIMLGEAVRHRTSIYLNNRLEQDYHGIKGRIRCV